MTYPLLHYTPTGYDLPHRLWRSPLRAFSPSRVLLRQFMICSPRTRGVHILDEIGINDQPTNDVSVVAAKAGPSPPGSVVAAKAGSFPSGNVIAAKAGSPQSTSEFDHYGFAVAAKTGHSPRWVCGCSESWTRPGGQISARRSIRFCIFRVQSCGNNSMGYSFPRQDEITPRNPIDGFELPRELGHGLEPKPSWDGVFVAKASPSLPMEEETWVGDVPAAKAGAFPHIAVTKRTSSMRLVSLAT